ncbi:MAG: hypothetical protein ACFE7E_05710 [Candidatus Hodarchaeota archaeon]
MSFGLLYMDEMKGFYKSNVMIVLWVGLPLISILFHLLQPDMVGYSFAMLASLVISSVGGSLASVMLSTSIISEKNQHVYELFLIRPIKRRSLLLAKFLAVYTCLLIASAISILAGIMIDIALRNMFPTSILESISTSIAAMAISCSFGLLIGATVSSVAVGAILSIFVANQLTTVSILPAIFTNLLNPLVFTTILGSSLTIALLTTAIVIFNRKQF